jgi:hypothetical protein
VVGEPGDFLFEMQSDGGYGLMLFVRHGLDRGCAARGTGRLVLR